MSYEQLKKSISIGPVKEAALYFEEVVPFDQHAAPNDETIPLYIPDEDRALSEKILKSLLPHVDEPMSFYRGYNALINSYWGIAAIRRTFEEEGDYDLDRHRDYVEAINACMKFEDFDVEKIVAELKTGRFDFGDYADHYAGSFEAGLQSIGFDDAPLWHYHDDLPASHRASDETATNAQNYVLALKELDLINAEKISWEKLIEFRKDKGSRAALRDLRLFFHENFEGKEAAYITDKLQSTVEAYNKTTKLWGLETARSALSLAITERGAIAGSIGTLSAIALGAPLAVAAAAGAALTLGNCVLELSKAAIERKKMEIDRPLRYFTKLKKLN